MDSIHSQQRRLPDASQVSPQKLAHFVLKTNNYEAIVDWYTKVLNARVGIKLPHVAFLTYDDEHHRLAVCNVPRLAKKNPNACGMDHIAFTYANLGDLLATYRRLASLGIKPRWPVNHGNTISLYYQDPDDNRVELQIDIFPTAAELENYFKNDPDYATNPLGGPIDPEWMIDAYQRGVPFGELVKVPGYPAGLGPMDLLDEMGLGKKVVPFE
jgi:catechol 2,3-dioxygenase-like lactoylglutathione lyase family enzyme